MKAALGRRECRHARKRLVLSAAVAGMHAFVLIYTRVGVGHPSHRRERCLSSRTLTWERRNRPGSREQLVRSRAASKEKVMTVTMVTIAATLVLVVWISVVCSKNPEEGFALTAALGVFAAVVVLLAL